MIIVLRKVRGAIPNKPGVKNWVEVAGGLPAYIDDVAGALYTKRGFSVSHAIATAVSKIKKWMVTGSPAVKAKAAKAIAQWEKMRASSGSSFKKSLFGLPNIAEAEAVMALPLDVRLEILAEES